MRVSVPAEHCACFVCFDPTHRYPFVSGVGGRAKSGCASPPLDLDSAPYLSMSALSGVLSLELSPGALIDW